ncbi:MAG: hypothetical protein PHE45_04120 [Bacteroidales bacterium]|nr:hypothetical protein [Bacteroidales bacterium]
MKKINIALILLLFTITLTAQVPEEALRYSRLSYTSGTARSASMAGAFGALGGDFSTLTTNPAGIGIYRSCEFSFTPSLSYTVSKSTYYDNERNDSETQFNIANIGYTHVFEATANGKQAGFKYFQFGLGLNRTNNFDRNVLATGYNEESSITTQWVNEISRNNPNFLNDEDSIPNSLNDYSTALAWNSYLIDFDTDNGFFFSDMEGGKVQQTIRLTSEGSQNEFVFSGGTNWNDKLYFGITLGIPYYNYYERYRIKEEDINSVNPYFSDMQYTTTLRSSGTGINFKAGMIYKPVEWLRIGAAIHTPTLYDVSDTYQAQIEANYDQEINGYFSYNDQSSISTFSYQLVTPLRAIGSLGFVIVNTGIISVDYTYQDYSTMKFKDDEYILDDANEIIKESYTATHNVRIGGELALGFLRLRAGYGFETSPYQTDINNGFRSQICGGIGFRAGAIYTDFAFAHSKETLDFYPYSSSYVEAASTRYLANQFQLTFGFRF